MGILRDKDSSCCYSDSQCCTNDIREQDIQIVSTSLTFKDILGAWRVRWSFGRMDYTVEPGLYVIGNPDRDSPVLVSSNYKLTFDTVRKNLIDINCWLLILDTNGVNVWCAAGKGTFGTEEVINRINAVGLKEIVNHRVLILPQLGAPGISAHEVSRHTGFVIKYGPVRANDIKEYLSSGCIATKEMRIVKFTLWDRLILTPMELVVMLKITMIVLGVLFLINLFATRVFGIHDFVIYMASILIGAVITPILLPIIPGRAFSFKGWLLGMICIAPIVWVFNWFDLSNLLLGIGYMLILPAHSAFIAMNFTGASTYTSPSGVLKEMKIAIPLILFSSIIGAVLLLIKTFTG